MFFQDRSWLKIDSVIESNWQEHRYSLEPTLLEDPPATVAVHHHVDHKTAFQVGVWITVLVEYGHLNI